MPCQEFFPPESNSAFSTYAHPEVLVSSSWLSARLGSPGLRVIETDHNRQIYDLGHLPSASCIDWRRDLTDPLQRQLLSPSDFSTLMCSLGINREDTVVMYGDHANCWASFAFWVFKLFGHEDVRLLDGGRDAWMAEERPLSFTVPDTDPSSYPVVERDDSTFRIGVRELHDRLEELTVVDVRSHQNNRGLSLSSRVALRQGRIPHALRIPWSTAVHANSRFRSRRSLNRLYADLLEADSSGAVFYGLRGECSAHSWFVAHYLLGIDHARSYDGSWVEWANMIGMPIECKAADTSD